MIINDNSMTNTKACMSYGMFLVLYYKTIKVRKMKELEETNAHRASY